MTGPESPAAGSLEDFLPYRLSLASNAVSGRIADLYRARFGLKITEWRLMAVLGGGRPLTQRDLVHATLLDKVAVTRACRSLEDRGLVTREPHESDGRSHHVALTAEGDAIYAQVMPLAHECERALREGFGEAEWQALSTALDRLRELAARIGPDAQP